MALDSSDKSFAGVVASKIIIGKGKDTIDVTAGSVVVGGRKPPVTCLKGLAGMIGNRECKCEIIQVLYFQYACGEGVTLYHSIMYKEYTVPDFIL
jgi:hypothetical protein